MFFLLISLAQLVLLNVKVYQVTKALVVPSVKKNDMSSSWSNLVVVMHSGHPDRQFYTEYAKGTWLQQVKNYVIVDGAKIEKRRRLMHVYYDDNPGCSNKPCPHGEEPHYLRIGKYYGAHRTVAGILVANDTWPKADWILVVDDDDSVNIQAVKNYLAQLNPRIPLLLAGRIGPGHNAIPCVKTNTNLSSWSCCTDPSKSCRVNLYGPQAQWKYSESHKSFLPHPCQDHAVSNYCCRTKPWPQGINYGFPFRIDPDGPYRPHFSLLWPYGGLGYVLSRGLLDSISRESWQQCMYGLQCANADHRVMTCVLNAGFSLTRYLNGIPGIKHHIQIPAGGVAARKSTTNNINNYTTPTSTALLQQRKRTGPSPRSPSNRHHPPHHHRPPVSHQHPSVVQRQ
mmetsp:Transcript_5771/g.8203  ORF Transcript_5771/g.8203 Transcript_5771/m.8203 type:complete len:397 (-) Transcript_5771:37-1227(-)